MVAEAAGDAFQQALGIRHIPVIRENALGRDVGQCNDASPLADSVELFGNRQGLVQTDC